MNNGKIELVCFDLGRVLMRITDNWQQACEIAGVAVPTIQPDERAARMLNDLNCQYDTGKISLDQMAEQIAVIRGVRKQDVVETVKYVLRGPYDGAADLMAEVIATGVRTACLSNTAEPHWGMMTDPADRHFLPLSNFTYRFASHLVGHRKPHPEIYEHVEKTSGLSGEKIVFFDDTQEHIDGAKKFGWQVRHITHDGDPIRQLRSHLKEMGILQG